MGYVLFIISQKLFLPNYIYLSHQLFRQWCIYYFVVTVLLNNTWGQQFISLKRAIDTAYFQIFFKNTQFSCFQIKVCSVCECSCFYLSIWCVMTLILDLCNNLYIKPYWVQPTDTVMVMFKLEIINSMQILTRWDKAAVLQGCLKTFWINQACS